MSKGDALLPQREPAAITASRPRWRSHSGREQRRERAGLYTPNNRCRPEAPLTSLPKLTPVKNVGEDSGERERGRGGKEEQQKIKK